VRKSGVPAIGGYLPNSLAWAAIVSDTKAGKGCCGSPSDMMMGALPGSIPSISALRRGKGPSGKVSKRLCVRSGAVMKAQHLLDCPARGHGERSGGEAGPASRRVTILPGSLESV